MSGTQKGEFSYATFSIKLLLVSITIICGIVAAGRWGYERGLNAGAERFFTDLDEKEMVEKSNEFQGIATASIMRVAPNLAERYAAFIDSDDSGLNKILERGKFEGVVELRGGGAYFSFLTQSNDYNQKPHIELQQGSFSSGFYGGQFGVVVELPELVFKDLQFDDLPREFVGFSAQEFETYERSLPYRPKKAAVGDLYAVRTIEWNEYDIVAVFEVVDKDASSATIVWRLLKELPVPSKN